MISSSGHPTLIKIAYFEQNLGPVNSNMTTQWFFANKNYFHNSKIRLLRIVPKESGRGGGSRMALPIISAWQGCGTERWLGEGDLVVKLGRTKLQTGLGPHTCEQKGQGCLNGCWHRDVITSEVPQKEGVIPGKRGEKETLN